MLHLLTAGYGTDRRSFGLSFTAGIGGAADIAVGELDRVLDHLPLTPDPSFTFALDAYFYRIIFASSARPKDAPR